MSSASSHPAIVALLLASAGCAGDPEFAARVQAAKIRQNPETADVSQANLTLSLVGGGTTFCAGAAAPPQLRATVLAQGVTLRTPIRQHSKDDLPGTYPQSLIKLSVSPATLGPDWMLLPANQPGDALTLLSQPVVVSGELVKQPSVRATLRLTARYDCDQAASFAGRPGRPGGIGGRRGENGEDGLDLDVALTYLKAPAGQKLVMAKATPSVGSSLYFLLAPGRRLTLNLPGGDGGQGGDGQVTGTTYGGDIATTSVELGRGLGGDGGNGGRVVVRVDERHPELRAVVTAINPGGRGGAPGAGPGDEKTSAGRPGRAGAPARLHSQRVEEIFKEELDAGVPIVQETPAR